MCAASEANQTQTLWLCQAHFSLDTGLYWKSYSPLKRERQFQDKVKMAVAQNPYLIVANGANTIEENQYRIHVSSYITFLWNTAYLCPFVSLKEAADLQQWNVNTQIHNAGPLLFVDGEVSVAVCTYKNWLRKQGITSVNEVTEKKRKELLFLVGFWCHTLWDIITTTKQVACSNDVTMCLCWFSPEVNEIYLIRWSDLLWKKATVRKHKYICCVFVFVHN